MFNPILCIFISDIIQDYKIIIIRLNLIIFRFIIPIITIINLQATITITVDINQSKIIIYISKFILINVIQNDYKRLDKF